MRELSRHVGLDILAESRHMAPAVVAKVEPPGSASEIDAIASSSHSSPPFHFAGIPNYWFRASSRNAVRPRLRSSLMLRRTSVVSRVDCRPIAPAGPEARSVSTEVQTKPYYKAVGVAAEERARAMAGSSETFRAVGCRRHRVPSIRPSPRVTLIDMCISNRHSVTKKTATRMR